MMNNKKPMHGTPMPIDSAHLRLGNFGRLFPDLPTWAADMARADDMPGADDMEIPQNQAEEIAALLGGPGGIMHDAEDDSGNSEIPAAYTFFAQFVDHDITLDVHSELHGEALDEDALRELPNLRSASLDLDAVYGFGPDVSPHLYAPNQQGRLLVGSQVNGVENPNDVPRRTDGHALLGDPRNDENLFLSQLHLLFLRFHNRLLIEHDFERAQREARYHYQHLVLHDFLGRICDEGVYNFALPLIEANANRVQAEREYPFFRDALIDDGDRVRMPVEFAAAAYRFGHSMVRSQYPVNADYPAIEIFDERFGTLGFGQVPPELTVDWRFLLDVEARHPYARSKAIDHLLADELIRLPDPVVGRNAPQNDRALAFRNLLRGYVLRLPSGQQVARLLAQNYNATQPEVVERINPNQHLAFVEEVPEWRHVVAARAELGDSIPLFLYLMLEAGVIGEGDRLGPVGSAILMEVFGAMLVRGDTFLRANRWQPDRNIARNGDLTLADIVRYVSS